MITKKKRIKNAPILKSIITRKQKTSPAKALFRRVPKKCDLGMTKICSFFAHRLKWNGAVTLMKECVRDHKV